MKIFNKTYSQNYFCLASRFLVFILVVTSAPMVPSLLLGPQMAMFTSTTNTLPGLLKRSQLTPWHAWMLLITRHSQALWPVVAGMELLLSGSKVYMYVFFVLYCC